MFGPLVPPSFRGEPRWAHESAAALAWLDGLEDLARRRLTAWNLTVDGASRHGSNGIAIPVLSDDRPAVLKLQRPSPELERQAAALVEWAGRGTVRLLASELVDGALLLERLSDAPDVGSLPVEALLGELGRLLARQAVLTTLDVPGTTSYAAWVRNTLADRSAAAGSPLGPAQLTAVSAAAEVAAAAPEPSVLVNADLHPAQVMWRKGDGWCAVDPRPLRGAIEYQCAQLLWTTADLLPDSEALRRGLGIVVEAASMDPALAQAWTVIRAADYLLWGRAAGLTEDPERCRRILDALSA